MKLAIWEVGFFFFAMLALLGVIVLLGTAYGFPDDRIVGGEAADIEDVPYQLALEADPPFWPQVCGATVISKWTALTAAHCVIGYNQVNRIRVRAGSARVDGGSIHVARAIILHENFTEEPIDYDIAIVVVQEPFTFSTHIQPAILSSTTPQPGDEALVSGWGVQKEGGLFPAPTLRKVNIPIVNSTVCREEYAAEDGSYQVTESMICAGETGKDSCQGDSGGPLVMAGTLVGVVSWGLGCAREGYPGVYTDVAFFSDWLNKNNATTWV